MNMYEIEFCNEIDISRYKFYNEPIQCNLEDYHDARGQFIDHISKDPNVISIYQIGNVGVHGISDLDFITVLAKKSKLDQSYFSIKNFNEVTQYLLFHEQFFVNRNAMENINQVAPMSNISHVYGQRFSINDLTEEESNYNMLIQLNDICIVSLCYEYQKWTNYKKLNTRLLLARLNSLKFPIKMLYNLTGKRYTRFDKFIFDFKKFRENWFNIDEIERKNRLISFMYEADQVSQSLIKKILEHNLSKNIFEYDKIHVEKNKECFNGEGIPIMFCGYPTDELKHGKNLFLDLFWGCHLKEYALASGPVSEHIHKHLTFSHTYQIKNRAYQKLQQDHISLLNNLADFRKSIGISIGGIYTFGYGNLPQTYLSTLVNRLFLSCKGLI